MQLYVNEIDWRLFFVCVFVEQRVSTNLAAREVEVKIC